VFSRIEQSLKAFDEILQQYGIVKDNFVQLCNFAFALFNFFWRHFGFFSISNNIKVMAKDKKSKYHSYLIL